MQQKQGKEDPQELQYKQHCAWLWWGFMAEIYSNSFISGWEFEQQSVFVPSWSECCITCRSITKQQVAHWVSALSLKAFWCSKMMFYQKKTPPVTQRGHHIIVCFSHSFFFAFFILCPPWCFSSCRARDQLTDVIKAATKWVPCFWSLHKQKSQTQLKRLSSLCRCWQQVVVCVVQRQSCRSGKLHPGSERPGCCPR